MAKMLRPLHILSGAIFFAGAATTAPADQFFIENGSITGNLCVGIACVANEAFTIDTLRLKDPIVRMHFADTSVGGTTSGAFPATDWRIIINDQNAGGSNYFAVENSSNNRLPFLISASAPASALVLADGNVGLGTQLPVTNLHIVDLADARIRLQTALFQAGTWDIAALSSGDFLLVDANSGEAPFRVEQGTPGDSLYLTAGGFVGMGTDVPAQKLHMVTEDESTDAFALFEARGQGSDAAFLLEQSTTDTIWEFRNQASSGRLNVGIAGGNTPFKIDDLANNNLLRLGLNGAPNVVSVTGELRVNNAALNVPDYVFGDGYALRPLAEVQSFIDTHQHLPDMPSAAAMAQDGVSMAQMQMTLLKKVEELTLYTLAQEAKIEALKAQVVDHDAQAAVVSALAARLAAVEAAQ